MRAPRQGGDVLTISAVAGTTPKKYPLAPVAQNISYETVSDQPEAQPNQPVSVPITFHGGLGYDRYDERTGGCLTNTGILCSEPNVLRAPVAVNTVTLTDAGCPPMYFFEAGAPSATIGYDTASTSKGTGTTLTWSHTVGSNDDRLLVVGISNIAASSANGAQPTSVTYGGVALTWAGRRDAGTYVASLWYLVGPASGAASIVATFAASQTGIVGGATSWSNVNAQVPIGSYVSAAGSSLNPTVTATTATGEYVVDVVAVNTNRTFTEGANQTERWDDAQSTDVSGAGSTQAGSDGGVMSWTISGAGTPGWVIVAVAIKPACRPVLYTLSVEPTEVNAYKVSLDAGNYGTLLNTKTWTGATTEPMGRPAEYTDSSNTYWRMPLGDNGLIDSLTTIAASTNADTWSGGTDADARFLLAVKNELYRTTGTNEVCKLPRATDPETESGWGGEYYMGDPGFKITDIVEAGGISYLCKENGFFEWDGVGEGVNVLPEIGIAERNGQGACYYHGGWVIPAASGLWWTRTGKPIGPDSNPNNKGNHPSVGSGSYIKHGRWMGTATFGEYLYGLYVNSSGTGAYVMWGYEGRTDWGPIVWHAIAEVTADFNHFHGIYVSETSKFSATETRPCLWFADGNDVSYIWLDKDGAPMSRRGDIDVAASATAISGAIDFGYPRVPKQLKYISGWAEDMVTSDTFTAKVYRDGGTVETVGSAISADGYFDEYWTQDTNDTCRSLLFSPVWAAAGDVTDLNGPLVRDVQLHAILLPTVTRVWTFLLNAEEKIATTSKLIIDRMEAYANDLLKYKLPDGRSFNGVLGDIRLLRSNEIHELAVDRDDDGEKLPLPRYIMVATVREMPSS